MRATRTRARRKPAKKPRRPPKPVIDGQLLLSIEQAAGILGISTSLLFDLLARKAISLPVRQLPGVARSLIARADLEALARNLPVRAAESAPDAMGSGQGSGQPRPLAQAPRAFCEE
jgi:hypothetical protein